jgi:hypothetical protein
MLILQIILVANAAAPKMQMNKHAIKFVKGLPENRCRRTSERLRNRSDAYFKTIEVIFTKYDIPFR